MFNAIRIRIHKLFIKKQPNTAFKNPYTTTVSNGTYGKFKNPYVKENGEQKNVETVSKTTTDPSFFKDFISEIQDDLHVLATRTPASRAKTKQQDDLDAINAEQYKAFVELINAKKIDEL